MTRKKSLVTAISSIRHDQIMSKTYNTRLQSIKMLIIMKI